MQMKCSWGITKLKTVKYQILHYLCFWHVVYVLIFYSLNHFISFPYLFFPVSQMNEGEIKSILKHCEVSTIIFLWPSLGSPFFVGVFSSRIGKEKEKKKFFFNVIFELLFPSPLPGASLYFALSALSHLAWISCYLSWAALWFHQICFRSKKKIGEISAPELGAWWDLGILFMSGVEWISVSWTKDTPVILGGENSSVALCCRLLTGCLCGKRFGEDCEHSICLSVPHRIISAASLFTPGPRENLKVPLVVSFSQHSQQLWNTKH